MLLSVFLLLVGLALLIRGADWLVVGASALAKKYNMSDLAIGLTIVAFGTSAPELVVNTFASIQDRQDMVLGNVIGSNNFNLFAILGIAGLIIPLTVKSSTVWKEIPLSLVATLLLYVLANNFLAQGMPLLARIDGILLLMVFAFFLFYVYKQLKADPLEAEAMPKKLSGLKTWIFVILGLGGLVLGGQLAVNNAVNIATAWGLSEKVIGLTILAAGTSLPELATSVMAAIKKNSDIAIGNIVGSNIFNILFILPVSMLIKPVAYNAAFNTDLYLLAAGTVFLFIAMFIGHRKKLNRWQAGLLLLTYIGYTAYLLGKEA